MKRTETRHAREQRWKLSRPRAFLAAFALTGAAASCQRTLEGAPCPCAASEFVCCDGFCMRAEEASHACLLAGGERSWPPAHGGGGSGGLGAGGAWPSAGGRMSNVAGDLTWGAGTSGGNTNVLEPESLDSSGGEGGTRVIAGVVGGATAVGMGGVLSAGGATEAGGVGGLGGETDSTPPATVPPQYCSADGWCGGEMWLSAVWGSSPDDVWFLGLAGGSTIAFHGDGKRWETWRLVEVFNRPYDDYGPSLTSLWGSAEDDVWFGGGELVHYDGSGFSSVPLYDEADGEVPYLWIDAIWGSSGRDIWALDNNTESRLVHYDGERWKRDPVRTGESLQALWGSGSSDVWAVGTNGCVLRFDGARWSDCDGVPRPTQSTLLAISGTAPDNVFVLSEARIVYHWDGTRWRKRDLEVETPFPRAFWADSERFWVGTPGAIVNGGLSGELEFHETDPEAGLGTALWGFPTGEVWVAGVINSSAYFDGARLRTFIQPNFAIALWPASTDSLWAVSGDRILHAQSGVWSTSRETPSSQLVTIWGTSDENVWAAGGDIFHWDGKEWQRKNELPLQVSAIWGSSPKDVWAVGAGGGGGAGSELWHYTGDTFVKVQSPTNYGLSSIWGTAADDVWLTAEADGPWHFDGKVWTKAELVIDGTYHQPRYITGTSEADIWFLGWRAGAPDVVHWNGAEWRVFEELPIPRRVWTAGSAWVSGPCQIWLLGSQVDFEEQVAAFDGKDWRLERVGNFENDPVLTGASGELWIAGRTLIHRPADARSLSGFDCTAPAPKHPLACDPEQMESYSEPCGDCLTGSVTVSRLCGTNGRWQPWTRSGCVQTEPCVSDPGDDGI